MVALAELDAFCAFAVVVVDEEDALADVVDVDVEAAAFGA